MNKINRETWSPEKEQVRKELRDFELWEARKFWFALAIGGVLGVGMLLIVMAVAWMVSP